MKNKKVLITGAKGQLAQIFKEKLSSENEVFLLTKKDLNIAKFDQVEKVLLDKKPDIIFNCAAYNLVDQAEHDWQKALSVNGMALKYLAICSKKINARLVHYSSDYVFPGEKQEYNIADQPKPINKYGQSKLLGEKMVKDFANKYFIIRTSWLFGKNPKSSFPLKVLNWAKGRDSLKIVADQTGSPTFVGDLAEVSINLSQTDNFGLYHFSNNGQCSKYDWAKLILKQIGWKGKLEKAKASDFKTLAKRPKSTNLNNFPIEEILNYKTPSWQDATKRFLNNLNI